MAQSRLYKPFFRMSMLIVSLLPATLVSVSIYSKPAQALEYTDSDLALKDFEQMQNIVFKIKREDTGIEDADDSRHQKGKDALFVILSRGDRDGMRGQLVKNVQADLDDDYFDTVTEVGKQALKYVGDSKISVAERSTYFTILGNILSEYRPQAKTSLKSLFTQIRDAKIEPVDDLVRYRALRLTKGSASPSKTAEEILKI